MINISEFQEIFEKNKQHYFEDLKTYLKFKSISTDPAFANQANETAKWLVNHLNSFGCLSHQLETSGLPCVIAEYKCNVPGAKTLLFYGHYDVQPVDPLELWNCDPFEPIEKDGRIFARGAQDNKGQNFYFIKALEHVIKSGILKWNIKILLEGEEECGSPSITEYLSTISNGLKADLLLVCDTGTLKKELGAITMGLRGIAHLEVKLSGANKDLHSGVHGGMVKNPATEICRLIAALHDENGKIAIPNYYDDITELSRKDLDIASHFPITDLQYEQLVGIAPTGGEQGISAPVRRGLRPTVEVNGITSGYQGDGTKTIIPSEASAKISLRLAVGQDDRKCLQMLKDFLIKNAPKEFRVSFPLYHASGKGFSVSTQDTSIIKSAEILKEITGLDPLYIWEGASIPLIPLLSQSTGATPLMIGFGLEEDNIHAPNESFSLDQWRKGFLFCCRLLSDSI